MMYLVEIKTSANANHLFLNNMHDTTLDLFCDNENLDDRDHMIDQMRQVYFDAMVNNAENGDKFDACACYEEWIVDGVDPDDGEVEFTFVPDLTRLVEDN